MAAKANLQIDPERWVDEYGDPLYRYALMRLRDPVLAEEVVQETFLAGFKARKSFSGRSSERTWLTGILKHKIVDLFRKNSRERPASGADAAQTADLVEQELFDSSGHWKSGPSDWLTDPDKVAERGEFRQVLTSCVDNLPSRQQDAYALREFDNLDSAEICKLLDISETNLWVMLHRARLRLRNCLEHNWLDGEGK